MSWWCHWQIKLLAGRDMDLPQVDIAFVHSRKAKDRTTLQSAPTAAIEAKIHDGDTSGILTNIVISPFACEVWTTLPWQRSAPFCRPQRFPEGPDRPS
jgi:hypothetical protein